MKAKKAAKRLKKIETVLAGIIDDYSADKPVLRELLDSARGSIAQAKAKLTPRVSRTSAKKPVAKSATAKPGLSAEGRKKLSLAAKKRWARAKRKGVHALTGRPLRRTA
jgi:hypothetical protein